MEQEQSPLEIIFRDIERALDSGLHYLAIAVSLSIPDICAALECDPDKIWVTEKKYVAWCEANISDQLGFMTALDCYRLRCGVLHQGRFGHPKARFDHMLFTIPNPQRNVFHMNMMEIGGKKVLNLDTVTFCHDMISAARRWYEAKRDDGNVQANISNLVRLRPHGLAPFMVGMPLIA